MGQHYFTTTPGCNKSLFTVSFGDSDQAYYHVPADTLKYNLTEGWIMFKNRHGALIISTQRFLIEEE